MRFIARFTTTEVEDLMKYLTTYPLNDKECVRFTAVRLNSEQVPISELCDIFEVSRNTVQSWLKRYENGGFESLLDTL
ncbi:MAG: helix-turn-helix domain-containing protein [Bacteroidetes bacterium]|nr:MAG: helix-turn-helix domain-containing protein [Bacteroidota bacterium]